MKYISPIISDARASLGGTVFSRNPSGVYTRARVAPTQPRTPSQQNNRANFAAQTQAWRTLTPAQRLGWNNAAPTVTLKNSLGKEYSPSGFQLYVSRNRNLTLAGQSAISDYVEPTLPIGPPDWTIQPPEVFEGHMGFWQADDGGGNLPGQSFATFYATPALSPGITFVAPTLFRYLFSDDSRDTPWDLSSAWNSIIGGGLAAGQQVALKACILDVQSGATQGDTFQLLIAT
jgi:hypothetical protein